MYQLAARLGTDMTREYFFFNEALEEVILLIFVSFTFKIRKHFSK